MNSSLIRSLTVCSFSTLLVLASAHAAEFGAYGSAPPSLDYPSERNQAILDVKKNTWFQEELFFLSPVDPFPSQAIPPVDPISKQKVDQVLVGPAFKSRAYGSNYDYYRYVTFYNISKRKERIYALPIQRAQCYDKSDLFSNYSYSTTYTASVTASASIEGLGLSATISKSRSFTTVRGISATGGIVADYTPYAEKQDWEGTTYIQLLDSKTGIPKFLKKPTKKSPWWVTVFFPYAAEDKYPMDFEVKDADWTFLIERTIIETCPPSSGAR